jgi:hypothetical protein
MVVETEGRPRWFTSGDKLMWPLIGMGVAAARKAQLPMALKPLPDLAFCHHTGCIEAAGYANERGNILLRYASYAGRWKH